jgi:hypothetical protein
VIDRCNFDVKQRKNWIKIANEKGVHCDASYSTTTRMSASDAASRGSVMKPSFPMRRLEMCRQWLRISAHRHQSQNRKTNSPCNALVESSFAVLKLSPRSKRRMISPIVT